MGDADHFYTKDFNLAGAIKGGRTLESIECYISHTVYPGTAPLYRYFGYGDHFYAINFAEIGAAKSDYTLERVEDYIFTSQRKDTVSLHRYWEMEITFIQPIGLNLRMERMDRVMKGLLDMYSKLYLQPSSFN